MDLNFTSPEEQYGEAGDATYAAWLAEQERLCPATFVTGPRHDPYGTDCDLERGHAGPHIGSDPFGGEGHVQWEGGGSVAGDALPYRNVMSVAPDGTRAPYGQPARRAPRVRPACAWSVSSHDVEGEDVPPDLTRGEHSLSADGARCNAEREEIRSGSYWFCTRIPGHTGRHAAGNGMFVLAVWGAR